MLRIPYTCSSHLGKDSDTPSRMEKQSWNDIQRSVPIFLQYSTSMLDATNIRVESDSSSYVDRIIAASAFCSEFVEIAIQDLFSRVLRHWFNHEIYCRVCSDNHPSEPFVNLSGNISFDKADSWSWKMRSNSTAEWNLTIFLPKDFSIQFQWWNTVCQIKWSRKNIMIWTERNWAEVNNRRSKVTEVTEILKMQRISNYQLLDLQSEFSFISEFWFQRIMELIKRYLLQNICDLNFRK
jgi:hypothetical protein